MTFKLAVGGIEHETNTFRLQDAKSSDFDVVRGDALILKHEGVRSYLGGMLDAAASLGATVVPTLHADDEPSGIIDADAYAQMVDDLLLHIKRALPLDAVALALHGAGVAHGVSNIEVDICEKVRQLVGPEVKIVITLDLHGNLNPRLSELVDAAFGTRYHPHTDMFERGQDAVNIIPRLLDGSVIPELYIEKIPFLLAPVTTMYGVAAAVNDLCRQFEKDDDIVSCTFFHGFPYVDNSDLGASVLVVANGNAEKAGGAAKQIARLVWDSRETIGAQSFSPEAAVEIALSSGDWPVAVLDGADNPGGGCPGDGTYLLRAMLEADLREACYAAVCDPAVVRQSHEAGVGKTIQITLGGKTDEMHGAPIEANAYVKALTDGRFIRMSAEEKGRSMNVGPTVRLQVGGTEVIVVSERHQVYDPEIFLMHGIDVSRFKIVGIKSTNKWRDGFASIIKRDYLADSPGLMSQDLSRYDYKQIRRPLWPLDKETRY
jgi:microcystin degradation protein MlrC